jgi:hypothetical protein
VAVGGIPDGNHKLVFLVELDMVGDLEGEGIVAAAVATDRLAVDPDPCLPVHSAKVEQ